MAEKAPKQEKKDRFKRGLLVGAFAVGALALIA